MQYIKTIIFLAILSFLMLVIGDWIGSHSGIFIALMLVILMNLGALYSTQGLLRLFKAHEITDQNTDAITIIKALSQKMKLSTTPRLYRIDSESANALSIANFSGKKNIILTNGLLTSLNKEELTAILARELAQLEHGNQLPGSVSVYIAGSLLKIVSADTWKKVFGMKTDHGVNPLGLIASTLAPIAAFLIKINVSAKEVFEADQAGATFCENPPALSSALEKLTMINHAHPFPLAEVNPETASLFAVNPLKDARLTHLFAIQPSNENRIQKLS